MRSHRRPAFVAALGALLGVLHASASEAKPSFVTAVPAVPDSCSTCHTSPPALNVFGLDTQATLASGVPDWLAVCALDSDKDGQTNGAELGDPCCTWAKGSTPAYTTGLSKPYDPASTNALSCQTGGDAGEATAGAGGQTGSGGAAGSAGTAATGGTAGEPGSGGAAGSAGTTVTGGSSGTTGLAGSGPAVGGASGSAGATTTPPAAEAPADSGGASCRLAPRGGTYYGDLGMFGAAAIAAILRRRRAR